jgi:hypothetical protein
MEDEIKKTNQYIEILDMINNMLKLIPNSYVNAKELNNIKLSINKLQNNLINNLVQFNNSF